MAFTINKKDDSLTIYVSGDFDAVLAKELQNDLEKYKGENVK